VKRLLPLMLIAIGLFALTGNAQAAADVKVNVCHVDDSTQYQTIRISRNALKAHLRHGDVRGKCEKLPTEQAVVIFRCGPDEADGLVVTDVSLSLNVPEDGPDVVAGDNCADTNANLLNSSYRLEHVNSGAATEGLQTEYMYTAKVLIVEPEPVDQE